MWKQVYEQWLNELPKNHELYEELQSMAENETLLEDCFYKNLEFGTGGMRGEIGVGTNRINNFMIRKATFGLAQYLLSAYEDSKSRGVAIAYDTRYKSKEFAIEAAKVLGNHGIKTYIFKNPSPTPELSFAVRYLGAVAGIVITASHNPPQYNGYKLYGVDGCQLTPSAIQQIIKEVERVDNPLKIAVLEQDNNELLEWIGEDIDKAYMEKAISLIENKEVIRAVSKEMKIVFTSLHGTGHKLISTGLKELGFEQVYIVKEQANEDANFSTVKSPNPEDYQAFELAIESAKRVDADIILATDPDADRLGVAVKNNSGEYVILTGNQTGALLLDYLLTNKKEKGTLADNGKVIKTIVTSEIGRVIAETFKVETIDTLTGFKFIGEKIREFEENNTGTFLFGYEESYGYLIGDFVRDKDSVQIALVIAEVASFYKMKQMSLYDGLQKLFEKYGYFQEDLVSITLKGIEGTGKIAELMSFFRNLPNAIIEKIRISSLEDYQVSKKKCLATGAEEVIKLPKSDVLKFHLDNGSWFCVRPSGTEPKIKIYFAVQGNTWEESSILLEQLKSEIMELINQQIS